MPRRNPPVIPADTSPEAWRVQMDVFAGMSVDERLQRWAAFNRAGAEMEEGGVRRRHPDYDDRDVHLALVRLRYGDDLAGAAYPDEPLRQR